MIVPKKVLQVETVGWKHLFEKEYQEECYLEFEYPWQQGLNRLFLLRKKSMERFCDK
nr:hypothetical protein [uncultured Lachnoclostridium sp.]